MTTAKLLFFGVFGLFGSSCTAFHLPSNSPLSIPSNSRYSKHNINQDVRIRKLSGSKYDEYDNSDDNYYNPRLRPSWRIRKPMGQQRQQRMRHDNNALDKRKLQWLEQATERIVTQTTPGSLTEGKWHEVISLINAWTAFQKDIGETPIRIESLLKVLVEERKAGNSAVEINMTLYNKLLDAWACSSIFKTIPNNPMIGSQRAREILVTLQENYEYDTENELLRPNNESFRIVFHVVCKIEGALIGRRVIAWMEYLYKNNKNIDAKPTRSYYIKLLDTYARTKTPNAGILVEAFIRHMKYNGEIIDTLCYNIAIKAWCNKSRLKRGNNNNNNGREAAEHVDRILEEMKSNNQDICRPDVITYSSAISAWAVSGMKAHAVSRVEQLLRELEESDDIEPNTVALNAVMSAWVKSRNPAAVDRTEEILRQMELSTIAKPDLISYNTHLHALSIHSSPRRPDLSNRAEQLLKKMEDEYQNGSLDFGPNLFSYNLAIEAVCRLNEPNTAMRAAQLLRLLVKNDRIDPDTFSFNQVLAALSRSSDHGAAKTAEDLLRFMDESYKNGLHPNAKPDVTSYTAVINAHTRSGHKDAAENAHKLFEEMKIRSANGETHLKPTRIIYNSLIDCWAKSGGGTFAARKAESLLKEMQEMFDAGEKSVEPNLVSYNAVLNAWARSGTRCCGYQAEKYLDLMWKLYHAGVTNVKPNDFSYNTVINAISKSKNTGKAQKALRILRRMDKLYQAGNKEARPNEITYTAVINSCAFPSVPDMRVRRKNLDTALFTLKELQGSRYGHPNQITYGTFIKACANLLHDDAELRRETIKQVFEQCIEDGQVGKMVLHYMPRDIYQELMAEYAIVTVGSSSSTTNTKVSFNDLPLEWRSNVREEKEWKPRRNNNSRKSVVPSKSGHRRSHVSSTSKRKISKTSRRLKP